jgi:hypothetical protein
MILSVFIFSTTSLLAINSEPSDTIKKAVPVLSAFFQHGKVLPTNSFVRGNNLEHIPIKSFNAVSIQLTKQTNGNKLWEQLYNFPRYGLGVYGAKFTNAPEIGTPVAIYGMIEIPFKRWNRFSINSEIGLGLTFNWESFGEDHYNIALGAEESVYIDAGVSLEYDFNSGLSIDAGPSFTHFSNGALKKPNFGINTFAPKFSIGYNFGGNQTAYKYQTIPIFQKKSELIFSFFTGWENVLYKGNDVDSATMNKGVYYSTFGLGASYSRQITYKSKIGIGMMIGYYGAANSTITASNGKLNDNDANLANGMELSIFPSYELEISRLSVLLQPGFYLYRKSYTGRTPVAYQRIGVKYAVLKDIFIGINLRAYHFYISDYIEWTVSYRLHL